MANNGMDIDPEPPAESPALSYEMEQEKVTHLRNVAGTLGNMRLQNGINEAFSIQLECVGHANQGERQPCNTALNDNNDNIINIQLPYDPNASTEPELWSGNFHPISLHGSIEQIASDTKSIKDSLNFMARYISNKKVNSSKANELQDFEGIGDSIWNFLSAVYQANWDSFYMDNKSKLLREKIMSKFSTRTVPTAVKNNKEQHKPVPVTIDKVPLLPPLLVKSKKEVNVISKYFQNKKSLAKNLNQVGNNNPVRSYTQATKTSANTLDVLKIKEAFPALNANKTDQVNNIVKDNPKPKPRIQMTTKDPSRKQVIIPMSKENNNTFMKNSLLHVANINRQLRNVKSEVLVDYIHSSISDDLINS